MDAEQPLPSDGQLAVAARDGVAEAWAELELRHGRIAGAVSRRLYGRHGKSRTRIGLDELRAELLHGSGVVVDERNRALRAFRPRCIAAVTDGGFLDAASSPTDEAQLLASTFASLPEPWQAALWHHHVDLEPASAFTDVVGRTKANTDLLIDRATDDLVDAFVDELRIAGIEVDASGLHDRRNNIGVLLPEALVPRITTLSVADYRSAIGAESTLAPSAVAAPEAAPTDRADVVSQPVGDDIQPAVRTDAAVLPTDVDSAAASATDDQHTHEVSPASTGERPRLPSMGGPQGPHGPSVSADEIPPAPVVRSRRSGLVLALLFGVIAVALLGTAIALIDAFRGDGDTPPEGSGFVDGSDPGADRSLQENVFDIQFTDGDSGVALGDQLEISIKAPGPIFENSKGMLRILMANGGAADVESRLDVSPPDGIRIDGVAGIDGCTDAGADAATSTVCNMTVPPGETVAAEVNFTLAAPAVGRFVLETNVDTDPIDVAIEEVRELRYGAVGRGSVLMIGNSVLSCDEVSPACISARDDDGDGSILSRRDLPAAFVGAGPAFGVANSSSATLDLDGADVAAAFLFWSGDLVVADEAISTDGPIDNVTFGPPNGEPVEIVEATAVQMAESDDESEDQDGQYLAYADVTETVTASGSGSYLVGNVQSVELGGSHAGWSLVVVTDDDRKPLRQLMVMSPFDWVDADSSAVVVFPSENLRRAPAVLRMLTFDTDRGSQGDALNVNELAIGSDDGDLFASDIVGPRTPEHVDNFGTGIVEFRFELTAPDQLVGVEARSDDDSFHVGVVAVAVDIE